MQTHTHKHTKDTQTHSGIQTLKDRKIQTHKRTETQPDPETERKRKTDIQTDKQTDKQTHRHITKLSKALRCSAEVSTLYESLNIPTEPYSSPHSLAEFLRVLHSS